MSIDAQLEPSESYSLGKLYAALWRYAAEERPLVVLYTAMLVAAQAVRLAVPYFTGQAVNAMQTAGGTGLPDAGWDMIFVFFAAMLGWLLHGPARVIERFVAAGIRRRFIDALYAKVVGQKMSWHESHHSGDTIQRVEKSTSALFNFTQNQFLYLQNAVNLVGPIVAIFVLSTATGIAALASYLIIAIVLVKFDGAMIRLNREGNEAERYYSAALVDCLGNISTVIALRLQRATQRMLGHRLDDVFRPLRRGIVMNEAKWCVIDLLNNAIRSFLIVLYVWLLYRSPGGVLLGSAVMVFQYTQQIGGVVGSMAGAYQDLVRYQVDFASADPLLALPGREALGTAIIPEDWREIHISGLDFTYAASGRRNAGLHDVALTLRRGGRIALVGASGSGKSTLLRLLSGLYTADHGVFSVDGQVRADLHDLGAIAMIVPQEPEVFESSIGQNITLGVEHEADAVSRACDIAEFTPVLAHLPSGLASGIAERGINLSGGQKQRLALARGILAAADSSLILLDEPTSSLDLATEARIYDHLLRAFPRACIVSAIHRLHLLPRFDAIVLLAEGRIVDVGPLGELLQRQPAFRAQWEDYTASPARAKDAAMAEA